MGTPIENCKRLFGFAAPSVGRTSILRKTARSALASSAGRTCIFVRRLKMSISTQGIVSRSN